MSSNSYETKIMIVDDFPTMRRVAKTLLRQIGYKNFVEAEDGAQAYEKIKTEKDVGLIVSDMDMPNMSGIEFLQAIRKDPQFKAIPFLMVISETDKEKIVQAAKSGVSGVIVKPFTGQALQEKLSKLFQTRKAS